MLCVLIDWLIDCVVLVCKHSTTTAWRLDWLIWVDNLRQMTDILLESTVKRKKKVLHTFHSKLNVAQPYLMVVDKYCSKCVTHYVLTIQYSSQTIIIISSSMQQSMVRGTHCSSDKSEIFVHSHIWNAITPKRCKIGGTLVLITHSKSYMGVWLVPKLVTLNDLERRNGHFCVIFTEFGNFTGVLRKSGCSSHNYWQFTITMSSSKRLQRDRATPTV